ncbi:MAG: hypothetical protein KBT04_00915 [Bacteroidales bacterium]|nr:hypothetical protein [Candidatus Colimorpha onthohippi]
MPRCENRLLRSNERMDLTRITHPCARKTATHRAFAIGKGLYIIGVIWICLAGLVGCQKDEDYLCLNGTDEVALVFSTDTLAFDTVFCTMGSTTRQVRVINCHDQPVHLTSVTLREGRQSRFRINVDGDTAMVARDITIAAGDRIFIFVQPNIKPNDRTTPFVVEDAILFEIEGCSRQRLPLSAWGRNAVYHVPNKVLQTRGDDGKLQTPTDRYGNPYRYSVIDCDNWNHELPHVVIGYAVIDEGMHLRLEPGDELYFGNDAVLWVYNGGQLTAKGSESQPVLFTSIRHDGWYHTLPGQWGHIWLGGISGEAYPTSLPCTMDYVKIENGYYGVIVDSCDNQSPTLTINHSTIEHIKVAGIMSQDGWISSYRLLIADCGGATIYVPFGGRYSFDYLTSANYWNYDYRKTPSVIISNSYDYGDGVIERPVYQADFTNSIIYGDYKDCEVLLTAADSVGFYAMFDHCMIKGGAWDIDPQFANIANGDYHINAHSRELQKIGYYALRHPHRPPTNAQRDSMPTTQFNY